MSASLEEHAKNLGRALAEAIAKRPPKAGQKKRYPLDAIHKKHDGPMAKVGARAWLRHPDLVRGAIPSELEVVAYEGAAFVVSLKEIEGSSTEPSLPEEPPEVDEADEPDEPVTQDDALAVQERFYDIGDEPLPEPEEG